MRTTPALRRLAWGAVAVAVVTPLLRHRLKLRVPVVSALTWPAPAALALGSALTAPALAQSGGTLAQPPLQGPGGGSLAPADSNVLEPLPVEVPPYVNLEPPTAMSAQAGPDAVEPPATVRSDGGTPAVDPAAVPAQQSAGAAQAGSESDDAGSLPFTGFELAALAGIGLCLLTAGIALRPRRPAAS